MFRRLLSYLWPVAVTHTEGRHGDLSIRWEAGTKVLNSPNGNQSFGALHRVWQVVFQHLDLRQRPPNKVLLLGLGGGSVPTILRNECAIASPITAVELDPVMIDLAKTHFGLDRHAGLNVIVGDATIQVHALKERFDLILVDLFSDLDLARGVDSRAFLHGLRDRCADGGRICFNTVAYDEASEARCQAVHDHALTIFNAVHVLELEGWNRVLIIS